MGTQAGRPKRERWRPPRGRHRLPAEVVARSQRDRLLDAAVNVVAEKGYGATTVADLTKEAGVSRTTFYELFEDKEACFLAAYDAAADVLARRVAAAFETQEAWPDRVRAGLIVLLESLAGEPQVARLALVDVGSAGPRAQRRYRAALQRMTPFFDEGRDFAPGGRRLPANTSRMVLGAVTGLVADEIEAGRAERLPDLLPEILFATLVPYLGPAVAAKEAGER
ncbi:MAG TPA: TetR/AcrR family transcriptional regulator [Solirubrobacterales bacterium]|nr:TetR/AcrR family transcriptional regulator [Solirubrobacterales bacterium]